MRNPLVQRLMVGGSELDMGLFQRLTYVETLDLSGPRLLLKASDEDRILRDDFGVVEGATLVAQMDDTEQDGGLVVDEVFTIKAVDSDANERLTIQCLAAPVDALKDPAESAQFLTLKSVAAVLAEVTGLATDVGSFPLVDAWHLLPGERPSKRLRQLAREMGAAIWYSRGEIHMHPVDDLWSRDTTKTLHHDDRRKDRMAQIDDYALTYRKDMVEDRVKRGYSGWTMTEGVIGGGSMNEVTQHGRGDILRNLNKTLVPAIDLLVKGQGEHEPGDKLELKFHRSRDGRPFDESIPPEILVQSIASQQEKEQYRTRIKGVIVP